MMHNNPSTFQSAAATRDENYATIAIPKLLCCSFSSTKTQSTVEAVWRHLNCLTSNDFFFSLCAAPVEVA
jgi:hypothetical protein